METCTPRLLPPSAAVGNQVPRYSGWKPATEDVCLGVPRLLETKYRDIADGNTWMSVTCSRPLGAVGNQVPRYSGWKRTSPASSDASKSMVGNQVPRYSGWKLALTRGMPSAADVGNQVPRDSGFKTGLLTESDRFIELSSSVASITNAWCYTLCTPQQIQTRT